MDLTTGPLIAGNWKMNGNGAMARGFADELGGRLAERDEWPFQVLVCPPFPYLGGLAAAASGRFAIGAQDCHADATGAHTGDVGAEMLAELGCGAVIVGHSERRAAYGESDSAIAAKAAAAHRAGLIAIVCVGETLEEREAGKAEAVVGDQVLGSLPENASAANTVIAYEPVWAIGTGKAATSDDVAAMHGFLRRLLRTERAACAASKLLYGGSVKPDNAAELLGVPDVNGALIGGASLRAPEFWAIAAASMRG